MRTRARRALQNRGQVSRHGVATARALSDPCRDLRGALRPLKHAHFPSITEPVAVAERLRAIDGFKGTFAVQCALRLAPMFFVRPGELRSVEWGHFDLKKGEWRYLVTKTNTEHLVPLATQTVAILSDLHALTGQRRYVFPGRDPRSSCPANTLVLDTSAASARPRHGSLEGYVLNSLHPRAAESPPTNQLPMRCAKKCTVTQRPRPPGAVSKATVAPQRSAMRRTMDRPSPLPCSLVPSRR